MKSQNQIMLQQTIHALLDGNYDEAELILDSVLQNDINSVDTVFDLGITFAKANRFKESLCIFSRLCPIKKDDVRIPYNLGLIYSFLGNHKLALEAYDLALNIKPDDIDTLINQGSTYIDIKNYVLALEVLEKAIQINSNIPEAWSNKGIALCNLYLYQDSINAYNEAIKLAPNYYEAWSNKSIPLNKLKQFSEATEACDKAISLKPDYVEAWSNKGNILHGLKHYNEAIIHFDKALSLNPDYAEAWSNKGVTLNVLKRYDDAIAHFDKALSLKHDNAEIWSAKGNSLYQLRRYDEAIVYFDKALSLNSTIPEVWFNKANSLNALKRYDEAISFYEKGLSLNPNVDWVFGDYLHAKMKICNWLNLTESIEEIYKKVMVNEKISQPFNLLSLSDDSKLHKKMSEIYVQSRFPFNHFFEPILKRQGSQKIRLGYFSDDFKNHPVALLIAELFENHDRNKFEIYAFSLASASDELRNRLIKGVDHFVNVENLSNDQIVKLAKNLDIVIGIDLTGLTNYSRVTEIFSYRAAPIQVNYLGYPGTLGADYIDYIIADKTLIPEGAQSYYSEKIVYMPDSYQVNDRKRLISRREFTRPELGLPKDGFVFCCFNNNYKILPATFRVWVRILNAVEGSVLWLLEDNPLATENLKKEALNHGLDTKKLVFAKRMSLPEHLARHRLADLFLDTFPYNAHTTASDALWVGLPIVTFMGESFASRVAASLLNAIGLPELITYTQEEYAALAIELAENPKKLVKIKLKLAKNRVTTPLFNTPLFTKNIEAAYSKMYERYQANLEPKHIYI